ncbi:MAG: MaoC family dehydratase N-terminal domain-containing protein [Myxococcales bacterium]
MSDAVGLASWVGRREVRTDRVGANNLSAWNATLDRDDPLPRDGDAVPPGFHWTLFAPIARQAELGPDGHPRRGTFLPPVELPRRMWAGSRLRLHRPLRVGEPVEQVSVIERVDPKQGRAGPLVFVAVRRAISGADGAVAIEEVQDIVYREAPKTGEPAGRAEPAPAGSFRRQIVPDDVLLFRYSALTFNGHRIHYDRRYATTAEGYPGLVVHGPLIATLLLDLLRRQRPQATVERFEFKAARPTYDTAPFAVAGEQGDDASHYRLWSTDNGGALALSAEAWTR